MDFLGVTLNCAQVGGSLGTTNHTAATTAASQAAAAATTIAATLPSVSDGRNVPADVCARYNIFHHPLPIS